MQGIWYQSGLLWPEGPFSFPCLLGSSLAFAFLNTRELFPGTAPLSAELQCPPFSPTWPTTSSFRPFYPLPIYHCDSRVQPCVIGWLWYQGSNSGLSSAEQALCRTHAEPHLSLLAVLLRLWCFCFSLSGSTLVLNCKIFTQHGSCLFPHAVMWELCFGIWLCSLMNPRRLNQCLEHRQLLASIHFVKLMLTKCGWQ